MHFKPVVLLAELTVCISQHFYVTMTFLSKLYSCWLLLRWLPQSFIPIGCCHDVFLQALFILAVTLAFPSKLYSYWLLPWRFPCYCIPIGCYLDISLPALFLLAVTITIPLKLYSYWLGNRGLPCYICTVPGFVSIVSYCLLPCCIPIDM